MKARYVITVSLILGLAAALGGGLFTPEAVADTHDEEPPTPEAEYQWWIVKDDSGSLLLRADGSDVADRTSYDTFRWRLDDFGDLAVDRISDSSVIYLSENDATPGVEYELEFAILSDTNTADISDEDNRVISSVDHNVGIPALELSAECREDDAGQKNYLTAEVMPEGVEFSNILDVDYTFYQIEDGQQEEVTDPMVSENEYSLGQHRYNYVAEAELNVALEDYNITLRSETINGETADFCDQPDTEELNFGYQADGLNLTVEALNADDESVFNWDFTGNGEIDESGQEASYTYSEAGTKNVTLSTSELTSLGDVEKSIFIDPGTSHADSDGDGVEDSDESDSDGDGTGGDGDSGDDYVPPAEVEGGLVNCGQTNSDGEIANWCDWSDFVELINRLISWLIGIATVVAALLFMYAGFLYLTAAGKENQVERATMIFSNVAVGFGIILIAWLLVSSVVTLLTGSNWIDDNSELLPISQEESVLIAAEDDKMENTNV